MFKPAEIIQIILVAAVLGFALSFSNLITLKDFGIASGIALAILLVNIIPKKLIANYLDTTIEMKIWQVQRYGFYERSYLKKPVPMGVILPFILSVVSTGYIKWLACMEFDIRPLPSRVSKRHGIYRFSELTESHIGSIAAAGIIANIAAAFIGYLAGLEVFAAYSIFYALFNMIPVSNLDGNKLFFGHRIVWFALAIILLVITAMIMIIP